MFNESVSHYAACAYAARYVNQACSCATAAHCNRGQYYAKLLVYNLAHVGVMQECIEGAEDASKLEQECMTGAEDASALAQE